MKIFGKVKVKLNMWTRGDIVGNKDQVGVNYLTICPMYRILGVSKRNNEYLYIPQVSYDGRTWLELTMIKDNNVIAAEFSSYVETLKFCNKDISDRIKTSIKLYEYSKKV